MTLDELLVQLEAAPRCDPLTLRREQIPSAPGVYVWYSKATGCPVYVGKAAGSKGLRHRIWAQHLNPIYLEGRIEKITAADSFQLGCAVVLRGQPRIDKSVLRRNIGRQSASGLVSRPSTTFASVSRWPGWLHRSRRSQCWSAV
jgi:hypothetical protein